MKYDLIMVAASRDQGLVAMTQRAIDSCLKDEADVNVILIETFKQATYTGVDKYILFEEDFNYNRCLNEGLKYRTGDIQILANNDIIFESGWSEIGEIMKANDYLSASAISNHAAHQTMQHGLYAYEGYDIYYIFTGWCLFQHRSVWDKIGRLDERNDFYYSDNVHAEQLRQAGISHHLICSVKVNHITSATLAKVDRVVRNKYIRATR